MNIRLYGFGAASLALILTFPAAADAQTSVNVALHFANGVHRERDVDYPGNGPIPDFRIEHRVKRWGLFVEGAPTGFAQYHNTAAGMPQTSSANFAAAGLRFYSGNGRYFAGVGATDYNQRTTSVPLIITAPGFAVGYGSERRVREASIRYELGAEILRGPRSHLDLEIGANPSVKANVYNRAFQASLANGAISNSLDNEWSFPIAGSQSDGKLSLTSEHGRWSATLGVRYLNNRLGPNGYVSDKNVFVMPFIGFTAKIGH